MAGPSAQLAVPVERMRASVPGRSRQDWGQTTHLCSRPNARFVRLDEIYLLGHARVRYLCMQPCVSPARGPRCERRHSRRVEGECHAVPRPWPWPDQSRAGGERTPVTWSSCDGAVVGCGRVRRASRRRGDNNSVPVVPRSSSSSSSHEHGCRTQRSSHNAPSGSSRPPRSLHSQPRCCSPRSQVRPHRTSLPRKLACWTLDRCIG